MIPTLTQIEVEQLNDLGFVTLPNFFPDLLEPLKKHINEIFAIEGNRAGSEFKQEPGCRRLANLVDKGDIFQQVIAHPRLLPYIRHVLGDQFKLSSLNVRSVDPHWTNSQPLHADMAAIADDRGYWVCNAVWMLDDITPENGPHPRHPRHPSPAKITSRYPH